SLREGAWIGRRGFGEPGDGRKCGMFGAPCASIEGRVPGPTVLIVCPQERDRYAIRAAGLEARYRVRYWGPDLDTFDNLDAAELLAEVEAQPADGVVASKDR